MAFAASLLLALVLASPALAQTAAVPMEAKAQALFEFLMARRMESEGDNAGALAALERARKLDPNSAEIAAEIAGHHSRQSRMPEAIAAAEQALKLDKDNVEAHHVLSLVYSAWADGVAPAPSGMSPPDS